MPLQSGLWFGCLHFLITLQESKLKNQIKKEHTWIYTNKNLLSIIYFCYKSGTEIEDMAIYNLGKTKKGNNIKILDYGLKNNRKIESQ